MIVAQEGFATSSRTLAERESRIADLERTLESTHAEMLAAQESFAGAEERNAASTQALLALQGEISTLSVAAAERERRVAELEMTLKNTHAEMLAAQKGFASAEERNAASTQALAAA